MAYRVLDGTTFRDIILESFKYLSARKKEVDSLNVFPVPDGDTGTNMSLTLSSAAEYLANKEGLHLYQAAEMASHGALMGARGNSGVILSQIFRGISKYFSGKESAPARELSGALDEAVSTAYKAVMKPVEGTILTVLRAIRDGAVAVSSEDATLVDVIEAGLARGREALDHTPDMLPVLKQAGVVDAGGKGLVYVLEGALQALNGERHKSESEGRSGPSRKEAVGTSRVKVEELETADIRYPYDTQLLVAGDRIPLSEMRSRLLEYGDSLLVVGSESLVRVHIHTGRPGEVLTVCMGYGSLSQVTVDNMMEQSRQASQSYLLSSNAVGGERGVVPLRSREYGAVDEVKETGILGVATGDGLKEIMTSLGCDLVLDGGSTMNPSTAELAEAVKSVRAKKVIFLPNNGNIFLAAKQAKKLVGRSMYIVPSKTIPQGISALLSLNLSEGMSHNLKRAAKAIKRVKTGEVTYAARDGRFGRHAMKQGDILGLIDGKVELVGADPAVVLESIVKRMMKPGDEVVTVYCGEDVTREARESALLTVKRIVGGDVEVEVHEGGQPLYYYIVSVE